MEELPHATCRSGVARHEGHRWSSPFHGTGCCGQRITSSLGLWFLGLNRTIEKMARKYNSTLYVVPSIRSSPVTPAASIHPDLPINYEWRCRLMSLIFKFLLFFIKCHFLKKVCIRHLDAAIGSLSRSYHAILEHKISSPPNWLFDRVTNSGKISIANFLRYR